jgi:hypothetical protein
MMTKRKSVGTTERTTEQTLTSLEEKVVRMRHGLRAPETLVLEHKGAGNTQLMAELAAMERRALDAVGPQHNDKKRKIVSALRAKK